MGVEELIDYYLSEEILFKREKGGVEEIGFK